MNPLDDTSKILTLDKSAMYKAIKDLPLQLKQAWEESSTITFPGVYKDIDNVIITGMGGSVLGAHTLLSLYRYRLQKPVEIVNGYHLPGYANERSLVIVSSNSGNTEETLSAFSEAKDRSCKIIIITTGGKLREAVEIDHFPAYVFDQKYNQTQQPRMSTGYMFLSTLAFFNSLELLSIDGSEVMQAIEGMNEAGKLNGIEITQKQNPAKQLASELIASLPLLVGAEFLGGAVHTMTNQINENSKKLAAYFMLSEMNHHLLEGLGYESNKDLINFIIFDSELYSSRIRQRVELTKTIIEENNFKVISVLIRGKTTLAQSCNLLQLGSYISYYMALLHNIDPSPIPWVNFLKKELADNQE